MPRKRSRRDDSSQQPGAAGDRKDALRDILHNAVNAGVEEAFQTLEQERTQADVESAQLLAEAQDKAAKVKEDAERHIAKMRSELQEDRAAFEEESAEIMRKLLEDRTALEEEVTSMEKGANFSDEQNTPQRRRPPLRNLVAISHLGAPHVLCVFVFWTLRAHFRRQGRILHRPGREELLLHPQFPSRPTPGASNSDRT
jgi:hypothetical protein